MTSFPDPASAPFAAPYQPAPASGAGEPGAPAWLSATARRVALVAILALAAALNVYALDQEGYANSYYAATVKSMLTSWHNFFFASFDPGGFVSVDKPPLGFWVQALSAKLLGFSGFSLLLPEALAGVGSVALLYVIIKRYFGPLAGLLAALALAITPISVVTNRNNTIDSLLVLCSLGAAWATLRAAERGSFRWLALAGLLVGLGFNIKMLESYLIVPALVAVYLLAPPLSWRTRLLHLAGFAAIMLVISAAWITAVDLTPAASRPWVGSTSTNSEWDLALGYNGIERLLGMGGSSLTYLVSGSSTVGAGGPGGVSENGPAGVLRLFDVQLGGQASWLLPLGLIGLLASGWAYDALALVRALPERIRSWRASPETRRDAHLSAAQASWVLWGLWTLVMAAFFSVAGFYHTYYLSMLAPGVAALAGIGAIVLWHDYRQTGWHGWLLVAALVVTGAVQAAILASYPAYASWLTPVVLGASLLAAVVLTWRRLARAGRIPDLQSFAGWRSAAIGRAALAVALTALLLPGLVWSGVSVASAANGATGALPHAGPAASTTAFAGGGRGGFGGFGGRGRPQGFEGFNGPPPSGFAGGPPSGFAGGPPSGFAGGPSGASGGQGGRPSGSFSGPGEASANSALIAYLEAHQGTATYLVAVSSANQAAPIILATGKAVMALGGFTGSDPILTVARLQTLVQSGQVRYFLLDGSSGRGPGGGASNSALENWVTANCTAVSASAAGTSGLYVCGG